jgi:uncharacterized protein (DUF488 family)
MTAVTGRILTLGHSNHSIDRFLGLLKRFEIQVLVDVRSHPYSRFAPHFDSRALKDAITRASMKYLFLGKELGGRPDGASFYDGEGYVLYWRVAESPVFLEGIQRLENGIQKFRVALLCSEEDPTGCHRRLLVGRVLNARGIHVDHIRGDGCLQSEADVEAAELRKRDNGQTAMFEAPTPPPPWRSVHPILQRNTREEDAR